MVELGIEAKHVTGKDLHLKEKVVKVMTLHSSKGLEFPIVAVAHVEEDYFPGLLPGMTDPGRSRNTKQTAASCSSWAAAGPCAAWPCSPIPARLPPIYTN